MSNLIATDVQGQQIESGIVDLFEIELPNGTKKFFHPGLDTNSQNVHFRDKENPGTVNEYIAIPMSIEGLEIQSDGALARPTFTVANVTSAFVDELGYTNNDLVGQRLTRRQTLEKYLDDGTGNSANPPVELNSVTYMIDRIATETNVQVTFEVAVVYDLEGVTIPRRIVRGKYCAWIYQGHELYDKGGCFWSKSSVTTSGVESSNSLFTSQVFFDEFDNHLSKSSDVAAVATSWSSSATGYTTSSYVSNSDTYYVSTFNHDASASTEPGTVSGKEHWQKVRTWNEWSSSSVSYSVGDLVRHKSTVNSRGIHSIFFCTAAHTSGSDKEPATISSYWRKEELCGKTINSCKCRFQASLTNPGQNNSLAKGTKDTTEQLPFGGFPGLSQY